VFDVSGCTLNTCITGCSGGYQWVRLVWCSWRSSLYNPCFTRWSSAMSGHTTLYVTSWIKF